ncbi:AAA-like domain-containing protein [Capilliphycus salinus ALCB114379]|uniref:AAA-like domain-containing protein n=1 Tax=Capilliphycus salinus TaxID=2768948 RepID=UPI0039A5AAE4
MPRSLKVHLQYIEKVKLAVKQNGFARQVDLAEDLGLARSTVSNFLNGKPVDYLNFYEITQRLNLDLQTIADFEDNSLNSEISISDEPIQSSLSSPSNTEISNYINRSSIESDCYKTLIKPGSLIRIKAPKLMGKTALLNDILNYGQQNNYQTVYINLQLADGTISQDLNKFLRWFCAVVCQQLKLTNKLSEYWEEDLGSNYNCKIYFEQYILPKINIALVLGLDDLDRIFSSSQIASDFLGLLRVFHDEAKSYPIWQKLRLAIAHATEVYIPLNINQSPFNVGVPIELVELTFEEVQEFAQKQGLNLQTAEIEQLINLVGGHPYLLQRAFYRLVRQEISVVELCRKATTESGIYCNHLRGHLLNLQQYPELEAALGEVVRSSDAVNLNPKLAYQLKSLGLVKYQGNNVVPSCELYRQYFEQYLEVK